MDRKVLYLDTETTGLDPHDHDMIQIAALIEINGKVVQTLDLHVQPLDWSTINMDALKVTHTTLEMLRAYDNPEQAYEYLIQTFRKYVDPFDVNNRFSLAGYNTQYDANFLNSWFKKICPQDHYGLGSYVNWNNTYDMLAEFRNRSFYQRHTYRDLKLSTVARANGLDHQPHNALSDVVVTRQLMKIYAR